MIKYISKKGISFIQKFEGCDLKAVKTLPTEKYYTIGYGHYGADVKKSDTITKEKAVELLQKDLIEFEKAVAKINEKGMYNFTQNQFDSLVSFAYNCGVGNLQKLCDNCNRSSLVIYNKLAEYCKSGGKVIKGLQNRRKAEQNLFKNNIY